MHFILRRVTSENRQSNEIIGKNYHLVYDDRKIEKGGGFSEKQTPMSLSYKQLIEGYSEDTHEKIHAFILGEIEKGGKLEHRRIPIYCKSKYYVMTESGKTFDTIKRCDY